MSVAEKYWKHYQTSESLQATADYFKVSKSAVQDALNRAGYPLRKPGRKPSGKSTKELTKERVRRYRQRKASS
jgi:predicted DNA-binding protein YlxM (UPF0122 family)